MNRQLEKLSRWIFTFDPNDASMDTNDDNDKQMIKVSNEVRDRAKQIKKHNQNENTLCKVLDDLSSALCNSPTFN